MKRFSFGTTKNVGFLGIFVLCIGLQVLSFWQSRQLNMLVTSEQFQAQHSAAAKSLIQEQGKKRDDNLRLVSLILSASVMLLLYSLSRSLLSPVKSLQEGASRFADGDLDYRIDVNTKDEFGQIARAFNDMAQQLKQARMLQEKLHQAQKMESIGRLASGVAHDFNSHLSIISAASTPLEDLLKNAKLSTRYLEIINASAQKSQELTKQLLAFGRKRSSSQRSLSLNQIAIDMQPMISRLIGSSVTLSLKLEDSLPEFIGDACQVEQIIMNLAINARDAMPEGGEITLETKTFSKKGQRYVKLSVIDNGEGFDEETKKRIFEPFFTTKSESKGTGLGLSIVFDALKQHNGYVEVESHVGVFTKFELFFPEAGSPAAPKMQDISAAVQ